MQPEQPVQQVVLIDRKSTRLNSSHLVISYAVFCLKKKTIKAEVAKDAASQDDAGNAAAAHSDGDDGQVGTAEEITAGAAKADASKAVFFFLKTRKPPGSTLFPSTTLFR